MRLPKERPTEKKVKKNPGDSQGTGKKKRIQERKERRKKESKEEKENSVLDTRGKHLGREWRAASQASQGSEGVEQRQLSHSRLQPQH